MEGKLRHEFETGELVISNKSSYKDFLDKWIELEIKPNLRPLTTYNHKSAIKNICRNLGQVQIQKLTPIQIKEHINKELKRGLKPSTILIQVRIIKQSLRKAVEWQIISKNPADFVTAPKVEEYKNGVFDDEHVFKVFEVTKYTDLYIPCLLGFLCGLRNGEICGLRWEDVNLAEKTANITNAYEWNPETGEMELSPLKTKNSKTAISLPDIVVTALKEERIKQLAEGRSKSKYVWTDENGNPHRPRHLQRRFATMLKNNGLPTSLRPHDMRHTFATMLFESGLSDKDVSEATRHAKCSFTADYYVHMRKTRKRLPAEAMNNKFGKLEND
jgi:integrase